MDHMAQRPHMQCKDVPQDKVWTAVYALSLYKYTFSKKADVEGKCRRSADHQRLSRMQ